MLSAENIGISLWNALRSGHAVG